MKIRSYKEYKCNGFCLKYYTRIINDYGVQRTIVIAYCDGRRMKDFAGEEKYALRSIICRLADEQRAAETEAYIKEQAARMGVSEYIVKAHIEEVQRKNMKATVPAEKLEITAEDIALYDYALGGAPVEGYTITCAETILKSMKKVGITPAAVERARKKINKEKKAAAPAPVVKPAPVVEAPAPDEQPAAFTPHIESNGDLHYENYTVKDDNGNAVVFGSYIPAGLLQNAPAADDAPASDDAPAAPVVDEQPAAAPSIKNADTPSNQKKQLAVWNGSVVEILEICAADNTAVVKIKGGTRTRIPADALEPTTAKKTTLPAWMMPGAVIDVKNAVRNDAPPTRHTIESVKSTNIYYTDGTYSSINYIMHYGSPVDDEAAETLATIKANAADGVSGIVLDGVASLARPEVLQAEVEKIETKLKEDITTASEKTDTTPASEKATAADNYLLTGAYPIWYERNLQIEHVYNRGKYMGTATENIGTIASWGRKQIKVAWVTGKKNVYTIRDFFELVESGKFIVSMPYDAEYMASLKQPTPAEQKTAPTDAEVMETAARIRANYEAIQADIEAEREQASAAFAEAITAYCEELSRPEPLDWEPETIIIPFEPRPAAEVEHPRRRHRLNLRPRLSRWLHPVRWVAVAFVVCLLSGLLLGMNTSTAAADDIAAAYDLAPVTVTAEAPDTFIKDEAPRLIEDKAPCLIEDKAPAPSPVKKLAAPSPVKNAAADAAECSSQKTDTADTPAGEKTASPMAPVADADGLTICEGTPWAYTMMNWA